MAAAQKQHGFLQSARYLFVLHLWQFLEAQVLQGWVLTGHQRHYCGVIRVFA